VNPLHERIRRLPPGVEFLVVITAAFGMPILSSIMSLGTGGASSAASVGALVFDNAVLLGVVIFEVVQSVFLVWFLRVRGWSVGHFAAYPSVRELAMAVGLTVVSAIVWVLPPLMLTSTDTGVTSGGAGLSWPGALAVSIINPLFEELFLCAYMLPFLTKRGGPALAVAGSLLVRLSFHTYQGPVGLLSIGLLGLVFTTFYLRTQRLWPVLIAHGVLDFVALANA